jgi:hypothetical protein
MPEGTAFDWPAPRRLDRRFYPSVHMFLPPASGQASITRILQRIAPPLYDLVAPERDAWRTMQALDEPGRPPQVESHGALYHWWFGATAVERALQAADLRIGQARTLVILRDPRDSLVSLYHLSLDPKHEPQKNHARYASYVAERERIAAMGLDEYVNAHANGWISQLEQVAAFADRCAAHGSLYLSYALLCHDFPQFLSRLMRFLRVQPPDETVDFLLRTEDVRRTDSLNPGSLARLAHAAPMPGRYRRELKPESITRLNAISAGLRDWMRAREDATLKALLDE